MTYQGSLGRGISSMYRISSSSASLKLRRLLKAFFCPAVSGSPCSSQTTASQVRNWPSSTPETKFSTASCRFQISSRGPSSRKSWVGMSGSNSQRIGAGFWAAVCFFRDMLSPSSITALLLHAAVLELLPTTARTRIVPSDLLLGFGLARQHQPRRRRDRWPGPGHVSSLLAGQLFQGEQPQPLGGRPQVPSPASSIVPSRPSQWQATLILAASPFLLSTASPASPK